MARPPRIEVAGGIYHVVSRGNEGQRVYRDDADRERFLDILAGVCDRYRCTILAYCLMGNHYHLLVRTGNANLASAIRQLNGVYAQWFNRRHTRRGHLFQGRYKAQLVEEGRQLLVVARYIVRNPVRAGLCAAPEEWRWSSHAELLGLRRRRIADPNVLLAQLAGGRASAVRSYLRLVDADEPDVGPVHELVRGCEAFVNAHLDRVVQSSEFPARLTRPLQPRASLEQVVDGVDDARGIASAVRQGYSLRAIAAHVGVHPSTVSRRLRAADAPSDGGRATCKT